MAGNRRSYGTGSLWERVDKGGVASWYAEWRTDGRKVRRKVGPARREGPGRADTGAS